MGSSRSASHFKSKNLPSGLLCLEKKENEALLLSARLCQIFPFRLRSELTSQNLMLIVLNRLE